MKNKKMYMSIVFAMVLAILLTACGKKVEQATVENHKKVIYASFFPVADFTKRIVGDKMEVKTIIQGSQEPHSFELQIQDMKKIAEADLIIFNGANMESFIVDLQKASKEEEKFLDLSQGLTILESVSDDHDHDHEKKEDHDHDHEHDHHGVNPHTWLSIRNAMIELDTIYQKVSSIDPENEAYYHENLKKALSEFEVLDKRFQEELAKIKKAEKYFVVSHAAFNYLADDYGLRQVAVTGISPEEEPSAKQLKEIADFVKQHRISTIFFEGKATPKVAETLAKETGVKTSTLYTMETLSEEEMAKGYLTLMQMNLEALVASFHE